MRTILTTFATLTALTALGGCSLIVDSGKYTGGGDAAVDTGADTSTDTGGDTNVPDGSPDTGGDAGPCPDPTGCDCDGDGFVVDMPTCPIEVPYPGAFRDCDDTNPNVFPGALPDCTTPEIESCASWGEAAMEMGFREMGLIPAQPFDVESPIRGMNPQIDVVREGFTGTDGVDYDGYLTYLTDDFLPMGSSDWVVANYTLMGDIAGSSAIVDAPLRGLSANGVAFARQIAGDALESRMVLSGSGDVLFAEEDVRNAIWPINIVVRNGQPAAVFRTSYIGGSDPGVELTALSAAGLSNAPRRTDIAAATHRLSRAAGPIYMTASQDGQLIHLWDGSDEIHSFEAPLVGLPMTGRADIVEVSPASGVSREYLIAIPVGDADAGQVVFANIQCGEDAPIARCELNGVEGWSAPERTILSLASSDGGPRPGGVVVASAERGRPGEALQNIVVRFRRPNGSPISVPLVAPLLRADETGIVDMVVRDLESSSRFRPTPGGYDAVFLAAVASADEPENQLYISGVRMCGNL